jgi:hypothetical protein
MSFAHLLNQLWDENELLKEVSSIVASDIKKFQSRFVYIQLEKHDSKKSKTKSFIEFEDCKSFDDYLTFELLGSAFVRVWNYKSEVYAQVHGHNADITNEIQNKTFFEVERKKHVCEKSLIKDDIRTAFQDLQGQLQKPNRISAEETKKAI